MVIEIVPHDVMSFHHPPQDLVAKDGPCGFYLIKSTMDTWQILGISHIYFPANVLLFELFISTFFYCDMWHNFGIFYKLFFF